MDQQPLDSPFCSRACFFTVVRQGLQISMIYWLILRLLMTALIWQPVGPHLAAHGLPNEGPPAKNCRLASINRFQATDS